MVLLDQDISFPFTNAILGVNPQKNAKMIPDCPNPSMLKAEQEESNRT